MKFGKIFLFLIVLAATVIPAGAAQRLVLLEAYTQWNCGPCAVWNPQERVVLEGFTRDTVVAIKYHVWWPAPSNDAFYLWNVPEQQTRTQYYGINAVPGGRTDGIIDIWHGNQLTQALLRADIRGRYVVPSPCTVDLNAHSSGQTSISFSGTITAEQNMTDTNLRLYVVLISDRVQYNTPPGLNGEVLFDNVFRDMWPSTNGQAFTLSAGGTFEFSGTLNKEAAWDPDNLSVVAFIQNTSTRQVQQAAWTGVSQFYVWDFTTAEPSQYIAPLNEERVYYLDLTNQGINDDTYTVALSADWPAGWTHTIETAGIAADPNSINVPLSSGSTAVLMARVHPNGNPGNAEFSVTVTSPNLPSVSTSHTFRLMSGLDVLVVDDDEGAARETWYMSALDAMQTDLAIGRWDVSQGALDADFFTDIDLVVWFTGDAFQNGTTITAQDQVMLAQYLDNGGRLFLSGQGIGFDLNPDPFLLDYLHTDYRRNYPGHFNLGGVAGDPITDGLDVVISGGDGANNQNRQSSLMPDGSGYATHFLTWDVEPTEGGYPAIRIDTETYRALYLGFGFEAISNATTRNTFMQRAVDWLMGATSTETPNGLVPGEFALGQNYPNPFNPETAIPFMLPERADVTLRVFDVLGREVATLARGMQEAGAHVINWNAADLSSGIYFYRLEAASGASTRTATRKLMLLK